MRTTLAFVTTIVLLAACRRQSTDADPEHEASVGDDVWSTDAAEMAAIDEEDVELEIWIIDVGQGDATLIVGPEVDGERFAMLVDAGRGSSARAIEPALKLAGVEALHVAIATHYDDDHIGGFTTRSGSPASLLWTAEYVNGQLRSCTARPFFPTVAIVDPGPGDRDSDAEEEWADCTEALTREPGDPAHIEVEGGRHLGDVFPLGGSYTATIVSGGGYVWGTTAPIDTAPSKNEMSVAVLVSNAAGFDFLVTGDLIGQPSDPGKPGALENAVLEGALGAKLRADGVKVEVLQVGHHGADNATEPGFISAI